MLTLFADETPTGIKGRSVRAIILRARLFNFNARVLTMRDEGGMTVARRLGIGPWAIWL